MSISMNTNPQKYILYDNRKAYFDHFKHVVKVIKQLTFRSSITSVYQGCADNAEEGGWVGDGGSKIWENFLM